MILLDIDGFKRANDTLGHINGDRLLIDIVDLIGKGIRPTDILVRWGGDEFVILAESDEGETIQVAERIRRGFETAKFGGPIAELDDLRNLLTVSIGISVYCEENSLDSMIYRADQA